MQCVDEFLEVSKLANSAMPLNPDPGPHIRTNSQQPGAGRSWPQLMHTNSTPPTATQKSYGNRHRHYRCRESVALDKQVRRAGLIKMEMVIPKQIDHSMASPSPGSRCFMYDSGIVTNATNCAPSRTYTSSSIPSPHIAALNRPRASRVASNRRSQSTALPESESVSHRAPLSKRWCASHGAEITGASAAAVKHASSDRLIRFSHCSIAAESGVMI